MKCAICGAPAPIGTHYALPEIQRVNGSYVNLVACSPACRAAWMQTRAERDAEVIAAQASDAAQRTFAQARAAFAGRTAA